MLLLPWLMVVKSIVAVVLNEWPLQGVVSSTKPTPTIGTIVDTKMVAREVSAVLSAIWLSGLNEAVSF